MKLYVIYMYTVFVKDNQIKVLSGTLLKNPPPTGHKPY